jgi:integrase
LIALDVDRLRLKLQRKGKRTQAARILELLRRTVNFGVKRGICPPLPFKIQIPKLNNQTTEDLAPDQLKRLLNALDADEDQRVANIMRIALYTGMRRGEILNLKWSDIDTERGFITLRDPKGGSDQKIPLSKLELPHFSGHLEKPNVYGQQEVFQCQRNQEKATVANLKWRPLS